MGTLLESTATLMCTHGGSVSVVAGNTSITLGGTPIAQSTDSFIVAGCAFVVGVAPMPCVRIQWVTTAMRSKTGSAFPLTTDSVGLCIGASGAPQGTVQIVSTQQAVSGL
jgi:hypothetical protein